MATQNSNNSGAATSARDLAQQYETNATRLSELADLMERENRDLTEAERTESETLRRSQEIIRMRLHGAATPAATAAAAPLDADRAVRECVLERHAPATVSLRREVTPQTTAALAGTGIIPVNEQEMLRPLRAGLIYDKVGINVRTGLAGQELRWPRHGKVAAQFLAEGAKVGDSKIDFSALTVKPERISVAVPVTCEELEASEGVVESVVRQEMPAAIIDLVNEAMFTTSKTYTPAGGGAAKERKVVGPFATTENIVTFAGAVPTRKELLKMKTLVFGSGIVPSAPCWVMSENMKAELEDVKVDAGSGRFLCENDTILGLPVFTTPYIGEGAIGLGDWSYQAAGFFGAMDLTVDPYTLARQHSTDFVLNTSFATVTLYPEAFALGKAKA